MSEREALDVLVAHIPATHTEEILQALFAVGAGAVGEYRECAFVQRGEGRFRPVGAANPTIGTVGELEHVVEDRVEVTFPRSRRAVVVGARRTLTRSPPSTSSSTPPSDACGEGHPGPSWWSSIPMDSVSGLGPSPQSAPTTRAC